MALLEVSLRIRRRKGGQRTDGSGFRKRGARRKSEGSQQVDRIEIQVEVEEDCRVVVVPTLSKVAIGDRLGDASYRTQYVDSRRESAKGGRARSCWQFPKR